MTSARLVRFTVVAFAAACLAGCDKTETAKPVPGVSGPAASRPVDAAPVAAAQPTPPPPPSSSEPIPAFGATPAPAAPAQPVGRAEDILVSVNGKGLTRGELMETVRDRLGPQMDRIPPEQLNMILKEFSDKMVDQFVNQTLAVAIVSNVTVTAEEEAATLKEVKSQLPPGRDLDEAMASDPKVAAQIREQIAMLAKADKLLGDKIAVADKDVDDFIEKNKEGLQMPERVRASHILKKFDPTDTAETKAAKKKALEDIRAELLKGADFAEMARKHSDCPSKQVGGDLGEMPREKTVKEFSDAAFSQKVNEIGPIVETEFGYHVIRVADHPQAGMMPRDQIAGIVKNMKRQEQLDVLIKAARPKANIKYFPATMEATKAPETAPASPAVAAPPAPAAPTPAEK